MPRRSNEVTLFLENNLELTFCEGSITIIEALLSKRKRLGKKAFAENITVVKQEKTSVINHPSVLISKRSEMAIEITVTSEGAIETFHIETKQTIEDLLTLLKRSPDTSDFAFRISSSAPQRMMQQFAQASIESLWITAQ